LHPQAARRRAISVLIKLKSVKLSVPDFNVLTAHTLRYAVTLTCVPLTFNLYNVSALMWSGFVPNFSEIEQSSADLWQFTDWKCWGPSQPWITE